MTNNLLKELDAMIDGRFTYKIIAPDALDLSKFPLVKLDKLIKKVTDEVLVWKRPKGVWMALLRSNQVDVSSAKIHMKLGAWVVLSLPALIESITNVVTDTCSFDQ